jgi:hypothetical protein
MSGRVAKATIDDSDLLEALEAAEEEHGSMADALRYALRATYAGDDNVGERVDTELPKAAREGYAALREHFNVGDRVALDAAEAIVAQRVQLRKETVRNSVIKKLHNAGWIVVEQGIHEVGIVVRNRAASDGGRNGDDDVFGDDRDNVDESEADEELEQLAEATVDRGESVETDGGQLLPDGGLRPEWAVEDVERELRAVLETAEDDDARYHTRQALQHLMAFEESREESQ